MWWLERTPVAPNVVAAVPAPPVPSAVVAAVPAAAEALPSAKKAFVSADPEPAVADAPGQEGWQTEVDAEAAKQVLAELTAGLGRPVDRASLAHHLAADFAATDLRPKDLAVAHGDGRIRVQRRPAAAAALPARNQDAPPEAAPHRDAAALAGALQALGAPWQGAAAPKVWWKIVGVVAKGPGLGEPANADRLEITAFYEAAGPREHATTAARIEQHATWTAQFVREGGQLKLTRIAVADFEETDRSGSAPMLAEVTRAVLGATPGYEAQLLRGANDWILRTEAAIGSDVIGHEGVSVADVNGDGLDDVYLPQPAGVPNRLYLQQADGTAMEASAAAGLDWLDRTRSAVLVDLDGDGDQDLAATVAWADGLQTRALVLAENDGQTRFTVRARLLVGADLHGLAAADFDLDGDLDLYACQFNPRELTTAGFGAPLPYHDANNGGRNALLKNQGGFRFDDVTEAVGLDVNNRRWSYAATWEDFDDDGDPDLHVANDHGRDCLYRNDGGRFRDIAPEAGVDDVSPGMSSSWGDVDRDGRLDLYVGNMFSSAGRRIATQAHFQPEADAATRGAFQRHALGNSLFRNLGGGRFADDTLASGTTVGRWAWASLFTDLDNDGWEDVVVANGMFTRDDPDDPGNKRDL